jgi:hypothetical protein
MRVARALKLHCFTQENIDARLHVERVGEPRGHEGRRHGQRSTKSFPGATVSGDSVTWANNRLEQRRADKTRARRQRVVGMLIPASEVTELYEVRAKRDGPCDSTSADERRIQTSEILQEVAGALAQPQPNSNLQSISQRQRSRFDKLKVPSPSREKQRARRRTALRSLCCLLFKFRWFENARRKTACSEIAVWRKSVLLRVFLCSLCDLL